MIIDTARLSLIPLECEQLRLLSEDIPALETQLSCRYDAEPLEGTFLAIVQGQLAILEREPHNFMWHSFWLILRREDRVVVGSADFKAPPDANGEVEIGYGLGEGYCQNGYMGETVKAMCEWAFKQPAVKRVKAETELDNTPSQSLLLKCGFTETERGESVWYAKDNPNSTL